jgi:hypothetical protein
MYPTEQDHLHLIQHFLFLEHLLFTLEEQVNLQLQCQHIQVHIL